MENGDGRSRRMIKNEASVMISVIKIEFRISPQALWFEKNVAKTFLIVAKTR